jgi:hypothetical protein
MKRVTPDRWCIWGQLTPTSGAALLVDDIPTEDDARSSAEGMVGHGQVYSAWVVGVFTEGDDDQ